MKSTAFQTRPAEIREVFQLLSHVPTGQRVLEAFMPLWQKGTVTFLPYPTEIRAQLTAALGPGQPIGAAFENDGVTGRIAYDPESPLGVLAPYLLHEMVHAIEPALWGDAVRNPETRKSILLRAEIKAFETQFQLTLELRERFPAFEEFLKTHFPQAKTLHQKLEQELIAELYGLQNSEIQDEIA